MHDCVSILLHDRLVEDLLALTDLEALAELFASEAFVDGGDLLVVDHHAALLDKTAASSGVDKSQLQAVMDGVAVSRLS